MIKKLALALKKAPVNAVIDFLSKGLLSSRAVHLKTRFRDIGWRSGSRERLRRLLVKGGSTLHRVGPQEIVQMWNHPERHDQRKPSIKRTVVFPSVDERHFPTSPLPHGVNGPELSRNGVFYKRELFYKINTVI